MKTEDGTSKIDVAQLLSPSDYLSFLEQRHDGKLDLVRLNQFITAMLSQEDQLRRDRVRAIIEAIAQPPRLRSIIQSILGDPKQLEELASKSFGHSTGMERIQLASAGPFSLRLHFWMPGTGEPITEDPHNHVYNFGSQILAGVLVTDLFARGEEGREMNMFQIASQTTHEKPAPEIIGSAKLATLSPPEGIAFSAHELPYTMSDKVIHRVRQWDPQRPIITLNIRGGAVKDRSTFFRDETMQTANPVPTKVDVENRLGLLLYVLAHNE